MIISAPGYENNFGTSCQTITELIDVYPTLTELCKFSDEQPAILQGKSLVTYLKNSKAIDHEAHAYTITNRGGAASLTTQRWKYSRWGEDVENGNEELYDRKKDPEENVNITGDPNKKEVLKEMREKFESAREKARSGL
jgi:iduronate 2-sulfatase